MDFFKDKVLLITGGTGSFGKAVLDRFLDTSIREIRIFSRDETKQHNMNLHYKSTHPDTYHKIKYYLGDVKDVQTLDYAMRGVDFVFHAAAYKHVPVCEIYPLEAVKTNIIGANNVLESVIKHGVKRAIFLSTDKAVYPINAMGISKLMMEKVVTARARNLDSSITKVCCTRYGNVMCSRGSVIPMFMDQIENNEDITITDPNMTRYIMSLDEAVNLVLYAFEHCKNGDIFVQQAQKCTIGVLADAIIDLYPNKKVNKVIVGARFGEKQDEHLLTVEELSRAKLEKGFYCVPMEDLSKQNKSKLSEENEPLLTKEEVKNKLLKLKYIQDRLENYKEK